jgi:hypothetical protein
VCISFRLFRVYIVPACSRVCILLLIPSFCSRGAGVRYELGHPHTISVDRENGTGMDHIAPAPATHPVTQGGTPIHHCKENN